MNKNAFLLLVCLFQVFFATQMSGRQKGDFTDQYYALANGEIDKQAAFKTVAFVEKRWRVVGNQGFNESIQYVVEQLKNAGFVEESAASGTDRLTYRLEKRPLDKPTWEPITASLKLASGEPLLNFTSNRNMIAINSFSTSNELELEVVYVGSGRKLDFPKDLSGKLVMAETSPGYLFREAVKKRKAAGIITYALPQYLQPEKNVNSIQFGGIPLDDYKKSFGILLSTQAHRRLKAALEKGENKVRVQIQTKVYKSEELTIVAELKGSATPNERFVFSAHVQEPGANDNATGVGALAEIAASSARLLKAGKIDPKRTITYLFGDEIISTRRYIQEDKERAKDIKWGMSLDMVGENTAVTGGTFLIEKMPDPGAIWVRGVEKHSEWGGRPLSKKELKPHYFNDLTIGVFEYIGEKNDWVVKFNPFEGGSDHVPFLSANIPGLLLWHFTDQFYHTDQDRIDKVSPETLKNVSTGALMIALMLTENKEGLSEHVLNDVAQTGFERLEAEYDLSKVALSNGGSIKKEADILTTWSDYYQQVLLTVSDIGAASEAEFKTRTDQKKQELKQKTANILSKLKD